MYCYYYSRYFGHAVILSSSYASTKSMFCLSLSDKFVFSAASQSLDVRYGRNALYSAVFNTIRVCSAIKKCVKFCSMIASWTFSFVVVILSGFVSLAPVFVILLSPGIIMFRIGSPIPLLSVLLIAFQSFKCISFFYNVLVCCCLFMVSCFSGILHIFYKFICLYLCYSL